MPIRWSKSSFSDPQSLARMGLPKICRTGPVIILSPTTHPGLPETAIAHADFPSHLPDHVADFLNSERP